MSDTKEFEARFDEYVAESEQSKPGSAPIAEAHMPSDQDAGNAVEAAKPVEPTSDAAAAAEELFPGYSTLPDEARSKLDEFIKQRDTESQARIRAAENDAKQAALEAKRYRNQLTPVRQKLTKLEQERSAHVPIAAAPKAPQSASKAERLKAELPDEYEGIAELAESYVAPLKAELESVKSSLAEAQQRQLLADIKEELSHEDPAWEKKTSSDAFYEWRDGLSNPKSEFYDPIMAEAIGRADKLDADAALFVYRQFNRDLAEWQDSVASQHPSSQPAVAKPIPDPSTRRGVVPQSASARPVDEFDRRYSEYVRMNP